MSPRAPMRAHNRDRSIAGQIRDVVDRFAAATPARFAIAIFSALVIVLTTLLVLPISARDGQATPLVDALFTAVSAICVTGLTTLDMATHWSAFGNTAILVGLQVGGIGVLTLASMLGLVVSRRLGLRQRLIAASDSNPSRIHVGPVSESQAIRLGEIGGLLATVAISALAIEFVLALVIIPRLLVEGLDVWPAIWQGFYFAASAFTNTGFVPSVGGMEAFAQDPWMLGAIGTGVFLGSLAFRSSSLSFASSSLELACRCTLDSRSPRRYCSSSLALSPS